MQAELEHWMLELEAGALFAESQAGWMTAVKDMQRQLADVAAEPWALAVYERLKVFAAAKSGSGEFGHFLLPDQLEA